MFSLRQRNLSTVVQQTIKNIEAPLCKNCIYFKPSTGINDNQIMHRGLCMKYGSRDVVTGEIYYDLAISARNTNKKCGSGTDYDPMDKSKIYKPNFILIGEI